MARPRSLAVAIGATLLILAGCAGDTQTAASSPVDRGRSIYEESCVSCHGDPVTGRGAFPGVPVHGPNGHTWHHADGQLTQVILGRIDYPGRTMPTFEGKLTEADVDDVLSYIKTGWEAEQRAFQAEISESWEILSGGGP